MKKILFAVAALVATVYADVFSCERDCGMCSRKTEDPNHFDQCMQQKITCALECLKGPRFEETKYTMVSQDQSGDIGTCEKDCGLSCAQCMIRTPFSIVTCLQEEAACALECLKGATVSKHHHHHHQ